MTFTILGIPRTKKNSPRIMRRRNGTPFVMPSAQANGQADMAAWQLPNAVRRDYRCQAGVAAFVLPVSLRALVYRDRNVGDLGNFLAAICDALERAGVVENDRLIQSFDGSRLMVDKANPRVEIELEAMR